MSENEFNSVPIRQRPQLETLVSSQAVTALQKQLTAAQSRVDGLVEQCKSLEAEVAELRSIKFKRFYNEECWIYQGDGEDNLGSLVCPVVVSPEKMIELEKAQQRVEELERENAELADEVAKHFFDPLQIKAVLERKPSKCTSERPVLDVARESVAKIDSLTAENQKLKDEVAKWKRIRTPTHGPCCTCQACGLDHDECRCSLDDLADDNQRLRGLLRECLPIVRHSVDERFNVELPTYQNRLQLRDRIKAAIGDQ